MDTLMHVTQPPAAVRPAAPVPMAAPAPPGQRSDAAWDDVSNAPVLDRFALGAIRILFDRGWYLFRHPDVAACGVEPLDHFLTSGLAEGRSPCSLFDPDFYLHQEGAPSSAEFLFLHYLKEGVSRNLDPHPLVDARLYAEQEPRLPRGTNPLTHMMGAGRRENRKPNPLFDARFYRRRNPALDMGAHPLVHYVTVGWRDRLQPHPLFDVGFYLSNRPDVASVGLDPLAHYLHSGHLEGVQASPLFDAAHYVSRCREVVPADRALLHFARRGCGDDRFPNPFFDAGFYVGEHPDVVRAGTDPFEHFLEVGLAEHRDPHPLFDSWFYRGRYEDVADSAIAPFLHYVRHGAREGRDPNPYFPAAVYLERHPEAAAHPSGPLGHFLETPAVHTERLCAQFDPAYYRGCHPGCAEWAARGIPPLSHYLAVGRIREALPVASQLQRHGWSRPPGAIAVSPDARPVLLAVAEPAHNETSLGAIQAATQMAADPQLDCRVVLAKDGPLAERFRTVAPTLLLASDRAGTELAFDRLADILHAFRDHTGGRGVVLLGGLPAAVAAGHAAGLGLPVLAWLQEMPLTADGLDDDQRAIRHLDRVSSRILVRSDAARHALAARYGVAGNRISVLPNGVAVAPEGADMRMAALVLRESLNLPPDALVVLGKGNVAFRFGTDLFIRAASQVVPRGLRDFPSDNALHQAFFVWIGAEDDPSFTRLCRHDIERLGLKERVRLVDPKQEPAGVLLGADLLLNTARDDASETAVLDARAFGLPVIGFEGNIASRSLSPEELTEVGYLDVEAMAEAVVRRGNRPARRTRRSLVERPAGPSWTDWKNGFRLLLDRLPPV